MLALPTLTIYPTGLTNLNGEATRALADAAAVLLLPPTTPGTRWQLIPRKQATGAYPLCGRTDRGNVRFRAAPLAASLFAALPPDHTGPVYMELQPAESGYQLVALHNSVQQ